MVNTEFALIGNKVEELSESKIKEYFAKFILEPTNRKDIDTLDDNLNDIERKTRMLLEAQGYVNEVDIWGSDKRDYLKRVSTSALKELKESNLVKLLENPKYLSPDNTYLILNLNIDLLKKENWKLKDLSNDSKRQQFNQYPFKLGSMDLQEGQQKLIDAYSNKIEGRFLKRNEFFNKKAINVIQVKNIKVNKKSSKLTIPFKIIINHTNSGVCEKIFKDAGVKTVIKDDPAKILARQGTERTVHKDPIQEKRFLQQKPLDEPKHRAGVGIPQKTFTPKKLQNMFGEDRPGIKRRTDTEMGATATLPKGQFGPFQPSGKKTKEGEDIIEAIGEDIQDWLTEQQHVDKEKHTFDLNENQIKTLSSIRRNVLNEGLYMHNAKAFLKTKFMTNGILWEMIEDDWYLLNPWTLGEYTFEGSIIYTSGAKILINLKIHSQPEKIISPEWLIAPAGRSFPVEYSQKGQDERASASKIRYAGYDPNLGEKEKGKPLSEDDPRTQGYNEARDWYANFISRRLKTLEKAVEAVA